MGIDRIFSLLTGCTNIRDVIMFPLVKPEIDNTIEKKDKNYQKILLVDAVRTLITSNTEYNEDSR
jgi:aspartyl-tRNA synthetase